MEVEAALPPPKIRLDGNTRQFAFRMAKLAKDHPINLEMQKANRDMEEEPTASAPGATNPARLTQIERLTNAIPKPQRIERIHHWAFPPWQRDTPYTVGISHKSKTEETTEHLTDIQSLQGSQTLVIYTDASKMETSTGIGIGIYGLDLTTGQELKKTMNIGNNNLVYNGELEGVVQALELAEQTATYGQEVRVYSDNQAAIQRLQKPSDKPGQECQIRAIQATQKAREKNVSVKLLWVPGHQDIKGNEEADKLAKEASQETPTQLGTTSFAMLGTRINAERDKVWLQQLEDKHKRKPPRPGSYRSKFQWKTRRKMQTPQGTRRETASAFYQLKIGHGYFKSYLSWIGRSETDKCACGKKETPEHLLLSCKAYSKERRQLKETLNTERLTFPLLFQTKVGTNATLKFIGQTRIATRKWYLQRREREEEEERERAEEG